MSDPRVPRRDFLATGLGLAAAALTTGRAGAVSPNDTINLGAIGCGVRGTYILGEALAAGAGKVNVVGVCDVWSMAREKMATDLAAKQGRRPKDFARYHDLEAMPGLDAVTITTPDFAHCAVLSDTVKAGKDAYVEKPLCARLEDALAAHDVVKGSDRIVQVGTQRRSSLKFRAAHTQEPFDPVKYRCWQPFYDHTTGLVGLGREAERTGKKVKYDAAARRILEA